MLDVPPTPPWGCGVHLSVLSAAGQVGHEAANVLHCPFADVFQRWALLPVQEKTSHGAWIVWSQRGNGKEGRRKEHKSLKSHTDNERPRNLNFFLFYFFFL